LRRGPIAGAAGPLLPLAQDGRDQQSARAAATDPHQRRHEAVMPREVIAERLASRGGHYMPASMLDSQLATLEEPSYDENAWVVDVTIPPDEIVNDLVARVSL